MVKLIGLVITAVCLSASGVRAAVKLTAEADRSEIGLDESLTIKLKLTADENVSLPEPTIRAPDFDEINSFPQTFLRNMWVNGQITTETQLTLTKVLRPRKVGTFQIQNIQAMVNGATLTAAPITIRVVGAGRGTPPPSSLSAETGARKGFMVKAEVSKSRVYHGEQVILSYYLYRRSKLVRPDVRKFPDLGDFNKQELEVPVQNSAGLEWEEVVVGGAPWARALLFRYAAYPIKKGSARVDPAHVEVQVPVRSQLDDLLEDSFLQMIPLPGLATRTVTAGSAPIQVEVLPLPDLGRPIDFSGLVGDVEMIAAADKTDLKANEALTVTLKLEGRANFAGLAKPTLSVPEGVESFEVRDRSKLGPGGIAEKIFEYVLVPRREGKYRLPPIKVTVFDPAKKQYKTLSTEPIDITVTPGAAQAAPISALDKKDVSQPSESSTQIPRPLLAALIGLGVFVLLALVTRALGSRLSRRRPVEPKTKKVIQRLDPQKAWADALRKGDFAGLENAFHSALAQSLGLTDGAEVRGMPRRELEKRWSDHEAKLRDWHLVTKILDSLESARFSGAEQPSGPDSPLLIQLRQLGKEFFG